MTQQAIQPSLLLAAVFAASTLGATHAAAATNTPDPKAPTDVASAAAAPSDVAPGMRAYIDPKTHKLRQPTAEERAAEGKANVAAAKQRGARISQIKPVRLANGAVRINTQGLFEEEATATLNADGSLSYGFQAADGNQLPHEAAKPEEK
jgi:hypothetical protein